MKIEPQCLPDMFTKVTLWLLTVELTEESEFFEEEVDLNNMALLSDSFLASLIDGEDYEERRELLDDMWFTNHSPNPLAEPTLECIGLACHPYQLLDVHLQ